MKLFWDSDKSSLHTTISSMAQERLTSRTRTDKRPNSSAKLTSRSLAISPNLDALLEFEERRHRIGSAIASPTKPDAELSSPSTPLTPTSLPPPPRGHKISKTPLACKAEDQSSTTYAIAQEVATTSMSSSSVLNPYINPAPTLQDLILPNSESNGLAVDHVVVGTPTAATATSKDALEMISGQSATEWHQPSFRHLTMLPWALDAKVVTSNPASQPTLKPDGEGELRTFQTKTLALFQNRPRQRVMKTIQSSRGNHAVKNEAKQGGGCSNSNSHGREKLRIRIDTEIFSSGDDSMFNFLNLSTPPSQGISISNSSNHSFIDLISPTQPEDGTNKLLITTTNKIKSSAESSSPKPPFENASKRIFDVSPSFKYRQKRPEPRSARECQLPLTTNLLDTNERAELVKKARKLARVFGQTPEAEILLQAVSEPHYTTTSQSRQNRRHSLPLSVRAGDGDVPVLPLHSPVSFIDLSDEDDNLSAIIAAPKLGRRRRSIASMSLSENISPEEQAEEDRRRNREKLGKLHHFLGSRVPPSLVLGVDVSNPSLPPERMYSSAVDDEPQPRAWLRRRSSSSAAEAPLPWSVKGDRLKADLGSREKALNVKRAQKMEKVFGVAPPQTLYHTRHMPSPSFDNISGPGRNQNRTAYTKHRSRKDARPNSSESSQELLPKESTALNDPDPIWSNSVPRGGKRSKVYTHYEHSLNSLHDILDRDDRASLAELHHYLNSDDQSPPSSPILQISPTRNPRASITSSSRSERRRSLPARTSMVSISSEISTTTSKPDLTDFQLRRRRAAKLTNFFGVDYRELVNDVLESIESGLEHERNRGSLPAEEAEDLLQRLRQLRRKRKDIY